MFTIVNWEGCYFTGTGYGDPIRSSQGNTKICNVQSNYMQRPNIDLDFNGDTLNGLTQTVTPSEGRNQQNVAHSHMTHTVQAHKYHARTSSAPEIGSRDNPVCERTKFTYQYI